MRRTILIYIFLGVLISGGGNACADEKIYDSIVSIEPYQASIGDLIRYTATLTYPKAYEVVTPIDLSENPDIRILNEHTETIVNDDGTITQINTIAFSVFAIGDISIHVPPVVLKKMDSEEIHLINLSPHVVTIRTVLDEAKDYFLYDIDTIVTIPNNRTLLINSIAAGVVLLAVFLIFFERKVRYARQNSKKAAQLSPSQKAYKSFEELMQSKTLLEGRTKELYSTISSILKKYINDRYSRDLSENTTAEIRTAMLVFIDDISASRTLMDIFDECDMVKFAKYRPTHEIIMVSIKKSKQFIDITKAEPNLVTLSEAT